MADSSESGQVSEDNSVTGRVSGGQQCKRTGKWRTAV